MTGSTVVPATGDFNIVCHPNGRLTVDADAETFARLGGRTMFGDVESVQTRLLDRIADAWYVADCPPGR